MSKTRHNRLQFLLKWAKRAFIGSAVLIAVGWAGAWFFLSEADTKTSLWVRDQILTTTADMGFVVEDVLVEGLENTDPDILKAVINIERGDPLFSLNPRDAKDLIEKISWVRSARVERRFPNTVYIEVQERVPLAFWQRNEKLNLLDERGEVITSERLSRFKDLMIVIGDDAPIHAPALIESLKSQPSLFDVAKSATWVGKRRWNLTLEPGIEVKLPEEQAAAAIERLAEAEAEDKILQKDIKGIDLREEGRIVVRTRPGKVTDYKKGSRI